MTIDVIATLRRLGVEHKEHGQEAWLVCPWCSYNGTKDGSCSINVESGLGRCHHGNRCTKNGFNLYDVRKACGDPTLKKARQSEPAAAAAGSEAKPSISDLETLARKYGLEWSEFTAAGCSLQFEFFRALKRKAWGVAYPLQLVSGLPSRGKCRSISRGADGKRAAVHLHKQGAGSGFFPPAALSGDGVLVVVGGEEKALCLSKCGFRSVNYSAGEKLSENAAAFLVEKGNHSFVLAFDADGAGLKGMQDAVVNLRKAGAESVLAIQWPEGTPDKYDLNNLLVDKGADAVRALIAGATVPGQKSATTTAGKTEKPRLALLSSMAIAATEFPPLRWAVVNLLPEGLAMFAGPPKVGKSLFCTHLAACVATGRPFLGYAVEQSEALYIDGESDARGFKRRLIATGWPDGAQSLNFFSAPPGWVVDSQGLAEIDAAIEAKPNLRLIVLDTLQRLVPTRGARNLDAYERGVIKLGELQKWTSDRGLCVVLIHHTSKQSAGSESFDEQSGSRGLTGTAENLLTVSRVEGNTFKLKIDSRHMEKMELAISREGTTWSILGDFEGATMSDERKLLLEFFKNNPEATPKQLAEALDWKRTVADTSIFRACKAGLLIKKGRGKYSVNPVTDWKDCKKESYNLTDLTGGVCTHARGEDWQITFERRQEELEELRRKGGIHSPDEEQEHWFSDEPEESAVR